MRGTNQNVVNLIVSFVSFVTLMDLWGVIIPTLPCNLSHVRYLFIIINVIQVYTIVFIYRKF